MAAWAKACGFAVGISNRPASPRAFACAVELRRRSLVTASAPALADSLRCTCRAAPCGWSGDRPSAAPLRRLKPAQRGRKPLRSRTHCGAGSGAAVEAGRGAPVSRCAGLKGAPSQPSLSTGNRVRLHVTLPAYCVCGALPRRVLASWRAGSVADSSASAPPCCGPLKVGRTVRRPSPVA